ncbi:hypothetical protein [Bradyrhizobium lablabi]|uniref:hypothetical protein n=1 Tax=Bradyrhizobium lablabi TaxID=722472 RepID=UPI001BA738C3|nr:hypothetical protein [Bradyrhizobium lablabi]MBR0695215.1 hypothetical protein [Bradyrhizobium lablabi]
MLYAPNVKPPQVVRSRCRKLRCGSILKTPTADLRAAFCCAACERVHYATHCQVCDAMIGKKSRRPSVCWRSQCRHELQRHPEKYRPRIGQNATKTVAATHPAGVGHNAQENPAKSTSKTGLKTGRACRVIADPTANLHPINLYDFAAKAAPRTGRSGPVVFVRSTPPRNIIGGFKFPGAPSIDRVFGPIPAKKD